MNFKPIREVAQEVGLVEKPNVMQDFGVRLLEGVALEKRRQEQLRVVGQAVPTGRLSRGTKAALVLGGVVLGLVCAADLSRPKQILGLGRKRKKRYG